MIENNINGKVVVITGASSGLGEAAAKHLSELGATVVLGARRADRIEMLARQINENGGQPLDIISTQYFSISYPQCRVC